MATGDRHRMGEVALLFLRLGATAFGGPAAHIALMRDEVVRRRRWMADEQFLDLLGATNIIPGPNSTEMAIHAGRVRAGWPGLVIAGIGFILPAAAIVLALAWAYVEYGTTPAFTSILAGVEPVVIAVIVHALVSLTWAAVRRPEGGIQRGLLLVIGGGAVAAYLLGANELLIMAVAGVIVAAARGAEGLGDRATGLMPWLAGAALPLAQTAGREPADLGRLFLVFLKIGSVLYGSGYVLLAFLRSDVVGAGWMTEQQLLDAVAIGQATPGPVFTTATFVGYVTASWWGAALATIGIFLPSFVLVALVGPLIPRIRRSVVAGAVLDGVTVAALGLMAGVTWQLGQRAIVDVGTAVLSALSLVVLLTTRLNPVWLILAGAALGVTLPGIG